MQFKNEMQAFPKMKLKKSLPKLIGTLDRIFSKYIRLRDADKNGMCRCITCGNSGHWKEMDAGHFIQRDRKPTRWEERNVHTQCPRCNRFRGGEQYLHGAAIDTRYGAGVVERLKLLSNMRSKLSAEWLEYQIERYKIKVTKLLTEIPQ